MSTITFGPYLFGACAPPFGLPLPWEWIIVPDEWVMARDGDGAKYIATKDELHLIEETETGFQLAEAYPRNFRP